MPDIRRPESGVEGDEGDRPPLEAAEPSVEAPGGFQKGAADLDGDQEGELAEGLAAPAAAGQEVIQLAGGARARDRLVHMGIGTVGD